MFSPRIKISLLIIVLLVSFSGSVLAETNIINNNEEGKIIIHFFDDRLCPVCKDAKEFIQDLEGEHPQIELNIYPISDTRKLREIAQEYQIEDYHIMAPTIFINDNFFQFRDFTSREKRMIVNALEGEEIEEDCCLIRIPFLNIEIDIKDYSLLFIAVLLGFIDGFNVCSVGALILVLSIVFILEDRKQIFFYGGLFIVAAVITYGALVFAWGKLFEVLVGQLEILRAIIGLAALLGGIYFFKEFLRFLKYGPACEVSDSKLVRKATERLKKAFEEPDKKFYLLVGSIISFAVIVTIIELPCSIGIPLAFAGILTESGVSTSSYIFYVSVYLFLYMLDELAVFAVAVLTKRIWLANSKIITWVTFLGSMVLFYLAFYYLF